MIQFQCFQYLHLNNQRGYKLHLIKIHEIQESRSENKDTDKNKSKKKGSKGKGYRDQKKR